MRYALLFIVLVVAATFACTNDVECSLNGECVKGECSCEPAWTGSTCAVLNVKLVPKNGGYKNPDTSTWGGALIKGPDDKYHMFVAEMAFHCGLNTWTRNSLIRHTISDTPEGPFSAAEVTLSYFAHNPNIITALDGTFLIYHIGCGDQRSNPQTNCKNGTTPPTDNSYSNSNKGSGGSGGHSTLKRPEYECGFSTSILYSKSLYGPWKNMTVLAGTGTRFPYSTDNPAPYIYPNGTTLLMFRSWNGNEQPHSLIGLSSAPKWDGPYDIPSKPIFTDQQEDPFMWRNKKGYFHALYHTMEVGACGRHAFSPDGVNWTLSPIPAYDTTVDFDDHTSHIFARRERPHLLFDENNNPTHLTNGVQPTWAEDYTYTLVAPINV